GGKSRGIRVFRILPLPLLDVHNLDPDRCFWARIHAGRFAPIGESAVAHVALADHAALRVVLRNSVRAVPRTVLAANAGLRAVLHDSGDRVLLIGLDRTSDQA